MIFGRFSNLAAIFCLGFLITACSSPISNTQSFSAPTTKNDLSYRAQPRVLIIGDSMLAWNSYSKRSVGYRLSNKLDEPVVDKSASGATVLGGLRGGISAQYTAGNWDWVVMNGGGNDLWLGCGCTLCEVHLDQMVSKDGNSGKIPRSVAKILQTGAEVIYVGYLRSPGTLSPIEHCRTSGDRLERRLKKMADVTDGFHFVSLERLVPKGDSSFHSVDRIHPSFKGSNAIANMVAQIIYNGEDDQKKRATILAAQ